MRFEDLSIVVWETLWHPDDLPENCKRLLSGNSGPELSYGGLCTVCVGGRAVIVGTMPAGELWRDDRDASASDGLSVTSMKGKEGEDRLRLQRKPISWPEHRG